MYMDEYEYVFCEGYTDPRTEFRMPTILDEPHVIVDDREPEDTERIVYPTFYAALDAYEKLLCEDGWEGDRYDLLEMYITDDFIEIVHAERFS
jgi:hypothetical protein